MPLQLYKIASTTVGSAGAASIDFSSIPQGYTDLLIRVSTRSDTSAITTGLFCIFNSDTVTTNYTTNRLYGTGSAVVSSILGTGASNYMQCGEMPAATSTAITFGNNDVYIPNYRSTVAKAVSVDAVTENNATGSIAMMNAGLYLGTAALTTLKLQCGVGNFTQHSTATLYGIL